MNNLIRESLSKSLFKYFNDGDDRITYQVPFVDKDGNHLPDEDIEYINIINATKELLDGGASPLYYITDRECFLITAIIKTLDGTGFSEKTKTEIPKLLLEYISEVELNGILPEHGNLLIKETLYDENTLLQLINKGLTFKQDLDNRYGNTAIEIEELNRGNYKFFETIIKYNMKLDFNLVYQKNEYNETTLKNELEKLKEKVINIEIKLKEKYSDNVFENNYELEKYQSKKETIKLLEKWNLKNNLENLEHNIIKIKKPKI